MRGHQEIIVARRRGMAPLSVWLDEYRPVWLGEVQYEPDDVAAVADLRFVVGLTVFVIGTDPVTVRAWMQACVRAKAHRVVASVVRHATEVRRGDCVELLDTAELLTWREHADPVA